LEEGLLSSPNNYIFNFWISHLLKQREKLLLFSQRRYWQVGRKEWLVDGNRNFKFFLLKTSTRRIIKLVMKIKDDCGIWIDDFNMVVDKFITDYTHRSKLAKM